MRRSFATPAQARVLRDAVAADTPDFVRLSVEGSALEIRLSARSAESARATLEDLFACLKVAERTASASGTSGRHETGERRVEER